MGSIYESDLIDNNVRSQLFYWITRRHSDSNYTVTVECAKVLVNMKNIKNTVQTEVVTNLGYLIHSTSSVNTYSALRIFHKLIQNPSRAFQLANTTSDIEQMTTHQNKEIRCQAVCIQIKSAKEEKIGSLLNKTFEIFLEIPDRTKIEIIESCISLGKHILLKFSHKFPRKNYDNLEIFMEMSQRQRRTSFQRQNHRCDV